MLSNNMADRPGFQRHEVGQYGSYGASGFGHGSFGMPSYLRNALGWAPGQGHLPSLGGQTAKPADTVPSSPSQPFEYAQIGQPVGAGPSLPNVLAQGGGLAGPQAMPPSYSQPFQLADDNDMLRRSRLMSMGG